MRLHRTGIMAMSAAVSVALALAIAGCGGGSSSGGAPTPFDGDPSGTPTSLAPSPTPAGTSTTAGPTRPPANRPLVIVGAGRYRSHPAVAGFTRAIQEFYRARLERNPDLMQAWVSSVFWTDNETQIRDARAGGLTMRPPGRIVVRAVRRGPIANSTTLDTCFGPTMSWYDPRKKRLTNDLPNGSAISIDMYNSGTAWQLYQAHPGHFSCATVTYPEGAG